MRVSSLELEREFSIETRVQTPRQITFQKLIVEELIIKIQK